MTRVLTFDDTTTNEVVALDYSGDGFILNVVDGGASQAAIDAGTQSRAAINRLAFAVATNDFGVAANGGAAVADTSGTVPTWTRAVVGGATPVFLRSLFIDDRRASNAELATFSAGNIAFSVDASVGASVATVSNGSILFAGGSSLLVTGQSTTATSGSFILEIIPGRATVPASRTFTAVA